MSPLLAVGGAVLVASNLLTAKVVWDYVTTKCENTQLKAEVQVVTVEKKVAVLDTKTLNDAIAREKERWTREQRGKEKVDEIIADHQSSPNPWCELSPNELRCWNNENLGFIQDDSCNVAGMGEELQGGPPS